MCATVALILGAWTAPLMAEGFNFGVTGAYTILFTEAQEKNQEGTLGPRGQGDTTEEALLPSVFLEYNFGERGNIGDGWVVGLDYIPIKPEVGDETRNTTDMNVNQITGDAVTQRAKADLAYHTTLYVESPGYLGGFYGKAGILGAVLRTDEELGTGSEYPDENILGATLGIGFKRYFVEGAFAKLEGSYTHYEHLALHAKRSGSDTAGLQGANKIEIEPQALALRLSFGYAF